MGQLQTAIVKQISEGEATYALREAWKLLYNEYPSIDSLALLWAQWALETGRGKSIWNYNFGNIKKNYKPDDGHDWCMYRCNELLGGKWVWFDPPHIQTHFRAYATAVDGAYDYVRFLSQKSRYAKAWEQVQKGDASAFCYALHDAGYFTAPVEQYKKGVVSLTGEFKKKADKLLAWKPQEAAPAVSLPDPDSSEKTSVETAPAAPLIEEPKPIVPPEPHEYHPEQEKPKNIKLPATGLGGLIELLANLFSKFS